MLTKAILKEAIDKFSENFTIDELIDRLIFLDKIERANSQSEQGKIISQEELGKQNDKWFE